MKKVAVGLSGGIDSTFCAYLLKKEGWNVIGFTLKFYPQDNRCCDVESLYQTKRFCHKLRIPHYVIDVEDLFKREIISYFIKSYLTGLTPNPCAFCNRIIKFGYFFEKIKSLGIDYLATGHYVRVEKKNRRVFLKRAKDENKTQEYFLSLINPQILKSLVFPLGDYTKEEIREEIKRLVKEKGIFFRERKESYDICFIKNKHYTEFIEENIDSFCEGEIKHIKGEILGKHKGIHYFTYGQREGLGINWSKPLYVIDIEEKTHTVVVGEKENLFKDKFIVKECNWFLNPVEFKDIKVKIRYSSPLYDCDLEIKDNFTLVHLKEKVDTPTPGQIVSFYYEDILLGGGVIGK